MGRNHLSALARSRRVTVTDVVEPMAETRAVLSEAGLRVHAGLRELLDEQPPEGILVAAPTGEHARLTREAVAAGVPVLCEKPGGGSAAELRETADLASRRRVPVQVAYWRRHLPALTALRSRIHASDLGSLYLVAASQWDEEPPAAGFRATSGGVFVDMGVHEVDQIRWLTGQEVVEVHAMAAAHVEDPAAGGDVDGACVLLRLSGGALATVSLGRYHSSGDIVMVEVFGSRGHERHCLIGPTESTAFETALIRQAESFADLVRIGRSGGAELRDAIRTLEVAEAATAALTRV
jgi:myo-inositol 2-dehydrogenase/D-chiro-inositol 1-dehydrogenase